jgi:hypothetical protein
MSHQLVRIKIPKRQLQQLKGRVCPSLSSYNVGKNQQELNFAWQATTIHCELVPMSDLQYILRIQAMRANLGHQPRVFRLFPGQSALIHI